MTTIHIILVQLISSFSVKRIFNFKYNIIERLHTCVSNVVVCQRPVSWCMGCPACQGGSWSTMTPRARSMLATHCLDFDAASIVSSLTPPPSIWHPTEHWNVQKSFVWLNKSANDQLMAFGPAVTGSLVEEMLPEMKVSTNWQNHGRGTYSIEWHVSIQPFRYQRIIIDSRKVDTYMRHQ